MHIVTEGLMYLGPELQTFLGSLLLLCGLQSTYEVQENGTDLDSAMLHLL